MIFCSSVGYIHLLINSKANGGPQAIATINKAIGKDDVLNSSIPFRTLFIKNILLM